MWLYQNNPRFIIRRYNERWMMLRFHMSRPGKRWRDSSLFDMSYYTRPKQQPCATYRHASSNPCIYNIYVYMVVAGLISVYTYIYARCDSIHHFLYYHYYTPLIFIPKQPLVLVHKLFFYQHTCLHLTYKLV